MSKLVYGETCTATELGAQRQGAHLEFATRRGSWSPPRWCTGRHRWGSALNEEKVETEKVIDCTEGVHSYNGEKTIYKWSNNTTDDTDTLTLGAVSAEPLGQLGLAGLVAHGPGGVAQAAVHHVVVPRNRRHALRNQAKG